MSILPPPPPPPPGAGRSSGAVPPPPPPPVGDGKPSQSVETPPATAQDAQKSAGSTLAASRGGLAGFTKKPIVIGVSILAFGVLATGAVLLGQSLQSQGLPSNSATDRIEPAAINQPVTGPTAETPVASPSPVATVSPTEPEEVVAAPEKSIKGTVVTLKKKGANIRSKPSTSATRTGGLNEKQKITIKCYTHGQTVSDKLGRTDIWYKVSKGYVSAAVLRPDGSRDVPRC